MSKANDDDDLREIVELLYQRLSQNGPFNTKLIGIDHDVGALSTSLQDLTRRLEAVEAALRELQKIVRP